MAPLPIRKPRARLAAWPGLAVIVLVLSPALGARPAAQETGPAEDEVRIVARTQERTEALVFASGDVEIHYRRFRLFADRVELRLETKDVLAEGNVVAHTEGQVIRAERARFNLETGLGTIEQASGMIQPSFLFEAESIEKRGPGLYSLKTGRLTACTQPNPRWSFSLSRADLKKDDHVTMWDAVLRIKSVPVLYLPYLRYPLEERATGFLMPRVGLSGTKGFSLSQSFFWAMAPNLDATVGFDYFSDRGLGAGLEFRYLFSGGTGGKVDLYHFMYKRDAAGNKPGGSSIVRLDHLQALPGGFKLAANADLQSSYDFLREFDNDFRRAVTFNRSSQVHLSRSWARFNLSARASRFETYFSELDDATVKTSLPQIQFNVFKVPLAGPLFFSLSSSFHAWSYGRKSEYEAGTERRSDTLSVIPAVSLPFSPAPWLTADTVLTGRFIYYGQRVDPESGLISNDGFFSPGFALRVELTGPVFYRVFHGRDGRPGLKNIIEPYFHYAFDSPVSQADRIVTAYGFFRFHQLSYGVNSRFLFKSGERPVEILSLGLGQTFYFSPEDGPLRDFPVDGQPPRFSEIAGTLRFYPESKFSLDASAGYNPYYKNLSSLRVSATAGSKLEGEFLSLSWFKSRNAWIPGVDPDLVTYYNRNQIGLFGGARLPRLSLDVQANVDFNLQESKLLYTGGRVTYHYQCIDFVVDVGVYYYRSQPEVQLRFSLGLGAIGRSLGFLEGAGF
ncbi:MAG: LPS assembly protein LptD [Candidatus Aminicenantes bacterium]